jgi:hypothetical protein
MKSLICLAISCLVLKKVKSADDDSSYACNRHLMESYDFDGTEKQSEAKNLVCPAITANCCDYHMQLQIYKKFVVSGERDRIMNFYSEFQTAYEQVFETFSEIEEIAKNVKAKTMDFPGSNCNKIASSIELLNVSKMYPVFKETLKKTNDFLFKSRQGFYCSLCDAKSHQFFNLTMNEITQSQGFCGKMTEETLNYFLFKYNYFVKISRLYSEFLVKCDLKGRYYKNKFLKYEIKFYRKDQIIAELESCKKGYDKPGAMAACSKFCTRFNPTKYDQFLEGEVDKLFGYEKSLKKLITAMKAKYDRELKAEEETKKLGRILTDEKEVKQTARMDEEINEINTFNKEFKTALVRPITYNFNEDLSVKYHINYDESLFAFGVERIYNLAEFKTVILPKGINFYNYGEMSTIDKDTAMKVFEKLNPNNAKDEAEFEKMLSN